jgi:hypothetical protein
MLPHKIQTLTKNVDVLMQVEIDQSGKIGKTNEDTVLAFSNHVQSAVLITRAVKQNCLLEYPGHNATIRRYLLNLLRRDGLDINKDRITFDFVGKNSPAHTIALATFRKQRPPDRVLTVAQLLALF